MVIAHRGASGYRPEHTLPAYDLAIQQGADFIEPDLVVTRDGVLIARHENALAKVQLDVNHQICRGEQGTPFVLEETTNVAEIERFKDRLTVKWIDGVPTGGWFSEDFTLAEIKTLKARERIPKIRPHNTQYNDQFPIPTLTEIIQWLQAVEKQTGRKVGIYPETKHPTFFAQEGTFLEGTPIQYSLGHRLIETLVDADFVESDRVFIQSFELENLIELHTQIMPRYGVDFPLVQLYGDITNTFLPPNSHFSRPYDIAFNVAQGKDLSAIYGDLTQIIQGGITTETGYGDLISEAVIQHLANTYATGMGPWKDSFLPCQALTQPVPAQNYPSAEITQQPTGEIQPFVKFALGIGLVVHPYTLRSEALFLSLHPDGTSQTVMDEVIQLLELGVTGFFIDQPDIGVAGRQTFLAHSDVLHGFSAEKSRFVRP